MGLFSLMKRTGNATAQGLADFGSGKTPHESIDTPKVFNTIIVIGIIGLGAGMWFIGKTISSSNVPVAGKKNTNATNTAVATTTLDALKSKDTDGDTLTDYDELFSYHSSPYLWSSAGDNVSDGDKIKRGLDPSCPSGQVCTPYQAATQPVGADGQLTPAFLRQALQQAGVAQTLLAQLSDSDLLRIYRQVSAQQQTNTNSGTAANTNTATNANTSLVPTTNSPQVGSIANTNSSSGSANTNSAGSTTINDLNGLTSTQIRQLLIQSGVSQETLTNVDDATLKQIFQQALNSSTQ